MRKLLLVITLSLVTSLCFGGTDYYITVAGAGTKDGLTWANAFGYAEWETNIEGTPVAGDRYFVTEGTYTLTSAFNFNTPDLTDADPGYVIGVKSGTTNEPPVSSDWAYTTARPLIAMGAYAFVWGLSFNVMNMQFTLTGSSSVMPDGDCYVYNCKAFNSSGTSSRDAFATTGDEVVFIECEMISTNGYGVDGRDNCTFLNNYFHDSNDGFGNGGYPNVFIGNVFDTIVAQGIDGSADSNMTVINNIFYNCGDGIQDESGGSWLVLNNIFDACTVGANWTTEQFTNYFDYNIWDSTTDVTNVTKGANAITADPALVDPANGDFTIVAGSNAIGAGWPVTTNTGISGTYAGGNIGVDLDPNASAGTSGYGFAG